MILFESIPVSNSWHCRRYLAFRELSLFERMLRELTLVGLTRRVVLREPMLRELTSRDLSLRLIDQLEVFQVSRAGGGSSGCDTRP